MGVFQLCECVRFGKKRRRCEVVDVRICNKTVLSLEGLLRGSYEDHSDPGLPVKSVNGNGTERWNKSS